jgi:hypothetical protein
LLLSVSWAHQQALTAGREEDEGERARGVVGEGKEERVVILKKLE